MIFHVKLLQMGLIASVVQHFHLSKCWPLHVAVLLFIFLKSKTIRYLHTKHILSQLLSYCCTISKLMQMSQVFHVVRSWPSANYGIKLESVIWVGLDDIRWITYISTGFNTDFGSDWLHNQKVVLFNKQSHGLLFLEWVWPDWGTKGNVVMPTQTQKGCWHILGSHELNQSYREKWYPFLFDLHRNKATTSTQSTQN